MCFWFHSDFINNKITLIFLDILAISTFEGVDQAYSINPNGGYKQLVFEFGKDTYVSYSCSLQWKNNYYVFGGGNDQRQVSIVSGNRLDRRGTLDFNFYSGACTVLNQITIVLCFHFETGLKVTGEDKVCRQSNNPLGSFTRLQNSKYAHKDTRIASFDGKNKTYNEPSI